MLQTEVATVLLSLSPKFLSVSSALASLGCTVGRMYRGYGRKEEEENHENVERILFTVQLTPKLFLSEQ